jgi:hypothetical protein
MPAGKPGSGVSFAPAGKSNKPNNTANPVHDCLARSGGFQMIFFMGLGNTGAAIIDGTAYHSLTLDHKNTA